jgi:hypothetical protein
MSFDDTFYEEIKSKKQQFENLSTYRQQQNSNYSSEQINAEISFQEVSDAIDDIQFTKHI